MVTDVPETPPAVPLGYPADAPSVWISSLGVVDPWKVVLPLTATVGRSDPGVQPEAGAATVQLLDITSVRRGESVQIWHGDKLRFTGRVTTIKATQTGGRTITELACLGNLARLAQVTVPVIERQEGTEQQRVASILAQLPPLAPIDPIMTMWGTQTHPFRFRREFVPDSPGDPPSIVTALHEVAANTGAVLRERPDGKIVYEALVGRDAVQRSATVSAYQIDDGVSWSKADVQPPQTVRVVYGPKPGDPVKPPERPGDLTGLDLDTIQVGGWWVGTPARNGPPWLPAGRGIWLSSAGDPVTGLAWQLATTQAVVGAESQVWLRQRVGGSWTAWRWQSGGLPDRVGVDGTLPVDTDIRGLTWLPITVVMTTPVPLRCLVSLHVGGVRVELAGAVNTIAIGVDDGHAASTVSFNSNGPNHGYGHATWHEAIPAGTTRWRVWMGGPSAPHAPARIVGSTPDVYLRVDPVRILDVDEIATRRLPVPIPELVPIDLTLPAPAPPVVI